MGILNVMKRSLGGGDCSAAVPGLAEHHIRERSRDAPVDVRVEPNKGILELDQGFLQKLFGEKSWWIADFHNSTKTLIRTPERYEFSGSLQPSGVRFYLRKKFRLPGPSPVLHDRAFPYGYSFTFVMMLWWRP
jgi:hypothetical protein